ncbi:hypothetical protein B0J12DRAFT_743597 [Macrophomina phaseolina]|uniref:Uncharacterized protein n=1 Tax=Macrophomina phaseolina TaxID=35725 RepID=A0ABQ8G1B6_9PEZI|nr:hypothetical protein B0J12DRAFT_743597 [Macrophomina phaseolina]
MARKRRSTAADTRPVKRSRVNAVPKTPNTARSTKAKASKPACATPRQISPTRRNSSDSFASTSSAPRNVATRSMTLRRRTQFPFLQLPAELRNLIYELTLDFDGVGRLLTDHYEAHVNDGTIIHWPELQTHPLLVVNKQISREARYILHRKTLRLPHSTTPNGMITDVVSRHLLENLRKVDITRDDSFGEMHTWCDFLEFFRLIKSAVKIWVDCHKLQELTIVMQGRQVVNHLDLCPAQGHCYFLDEIEKMMGSLKELRGIKKVTFGGFLKDYASEAKEWMETPPAYILKTIPLQVRKKIYSYLVNLNDANAALVKASNTAVASWNPPKTMDAIAPPRTSPAIIRANEQIRDEVYDTMYADTFTISAPPPHHVHTCTTITNFISEDNLRMVRHLALDIDSRGSAFVAADWRNLIQELVWILRPKHNLQSLHVNIRDQKWAEQQLKQQENNPSSSSSSSSTRWRMATVPRGNDFYGLQALCELATTRLPESRVKSVTFGEGVHEEVKKALKEYLCGATLDRYHGQALEGLEGLVAEG